MFKTKFLLGSLLFFSMPVFAYQESDPETYSQPLESKPKEPAIRMMNGYSAPARIEVRGSWDVYATASFIYWQARQENIEIGIISHNNPNISGDNPFNTGYVNNMVVTSPHFTYRPGFKFGLGVNLDWDNWDAYTEYTWFHGTINSGVSSLTPTTTGTSIPPNGEYLYPIQGPPGTFTNDLLQAPNFFQDASQSWVLRMDFLDLSLSRSYYSGTRLTVSPFFGARGAWIRQNLNTEYGAEAVFLINPSGASNATVHDAIASWGVGPRVGFASNWLLGHETRLIGNASADILYTRFHLHQDVQRTNLAQQFLNPVRSNAAVSQTIDYLRAHADFELGFGWGTYFDNSNWHIDLSATYGFQVFWDQNMFRNFESRVAKSFAPNGNLYVHGLTMNLDFDF